MDGTSPKESRRRNTDRGWLCTLALRASQLWDFIDKRDIDKHFVSIVILFGTFKVTKWAMEFAYFHAETGGIEAAAIIAAVLAPYMALQAAAVAWYFKARSNGDS